MGRRVSVPVRAYLAGATVLLFTACENSSAPKASGLAPKAGVINLAGRWTTQDTVRLAFARAVDGSPEVHVSINQLELTFTAASDTTYTFEWPGGFDHEYDSVSGQQVDSSVVASTGSVGYYALVRGDTAFVYLPENLLTAMPLSHATTTSISAQLDVALSDCLTALGALARADPAPTCHTGYHWTRSP